MRSSSAVVHDSAFAARGTVPWPGVCKGSDVAWLIAQAAPAQPISLGSSSGQGLERSQLAFLLFGKLP